MDGAYSDLECLSVTICAEVCYRLEIWVTNAKK